MKTKSSFTQMTLEEFEQWIVAQKVARTLLFLQQHHTYSPDYALFKGNNHFELQKSMRDYHVNHNGWSDIAQHFTIFPDGMIVTGRSLEAIPAGIKGCNSNAICIENLGNFDTGGDEMTNEQRESIIKVTAALCKRFSISVSTERIIYHHWYRLDTGVRNNGKGGNKSCPGTNFFGGNKVADCQANFLPLISARINGAPTSSETQILKYVCVTSDALNIRLGPSVSYDKAEDRQPALKGAILRVYEVKNNWYKISQSAENWVSGSKTREVLRAKVKTATLNVRNQPGTHGMVIGAFQKGQELL